MGGMATPDLESLVSELSNAGRWGPDDELGTLNLITPDKRRQAAALVREGVSVSMASDLSLVHSPRTDSLVFYEGSADPAAPVAVADTITLRVHGWSTHIDALGHIYNAGVGYNDRRRAEVFSSHGLLANAITAMRDGVFTRGVLLDVAAALDQPWLPFDHVITAAELETAEAAQGMTVDSGDALFVHTGLSTRLGAGDPGDADRRAGLGIDAVRWLRSRDVALFGGDCVDILPGTDPTLPLPLHQLGIGAMGLALLDWPRLDELVKACATYSRHEFLMTVAPLRIVGATGSPVNPIATF
jgi:kynurenine formamidase